MAPGIDVGNLVCALVRYYWYLIGTSETVGVREGSLVIGGPHPHCSGEKEPSCLTSILPDNFGKTIFARERF